MLRRLAPTLILLLVGLLALGAGLFALQRIFAQERADARAAVEGRRQALEQYAVAALQQRLRDWLSALEPEIAAALEDPLADDSGLYLRDRGEQLLPRRVVFLPGDASTAKGYFETLSRTPTRLKLDEPDSPFAERVRLHEAFVAALAGGEREAITQAVRAVLKHRARFVLGASEDMAQMLAFLDHFLTHGTPDRALVRSLLRDGLRGKGDQVMLGLQRQVLKQRDRLTEAEFAFLSARIMALSERAHVQRDDFLAQSQRRDSQPVAMPEAVEVPTLTNGRYYVKPEPDARLRGMEVDLPAEIGAVREEMLSRGLLEATDQLQSARDLEQGAVALPALSLRVDSPQWAEALGATDARYQLKSWMLFVIAALAFIVIALAVAVQWRKQRYLQLKSDFVATVSHELRTPLASIRLLAETLERRLEGVAQARDYPARIVKDIDGLSFLVENILSFNRLDKGRWAPRMSRVRLDDLIATVREDVAPQDGRDFELSAEDIDDVVLSADPDLMRLLFTNLARNACQYNERDPVRIDVSAKRDGKGLSVAVRDNGVGIPEGDRARIFNEFYRSKAGRGRGSGLGLAICRKIMAVHGGRIAIAATGTEGTTFELSFPAKLL